MTMHPGGSGGIAGKVEYSWARLRGRPGSGRAAMLAAAILLSALAAFGWLTCDDAASADTIITRLSTTSAGAQSNGPSHDASVSADGRYVVFSSVAGNLVAGDTNGVSDIFLKDTQTGATTRVSTDSGGGQAGGQSLFPAISGDGRFVAFESDATSLVAGDSNGLRDIFLKDTQTGATSKISTDTAGTAQGNGASEIAAISSDGSRITFRSDAANLVASDTNGTTDVFLRDTGAGTTTLVSTDSASVQANGQSGHTYGPAISGDGRFVAFESAATNLVAGDTNSFRDVFLRDTQLNTTTRVSVNTAELQAAGGDSLFPSLSGDGRYIAFRSEAVNLSADADTNAGINTGSDIFVRDTQLGVTNRVSTGPAGEQANNASWDPAISPDGNYVSFSTNATNLAPAATLGVFQVFVKNVQSGAIVLVSADSAGNEGNNWSLGPALSDGGRFVVFESIASNLVGGDTNLVEDIFIVNTGMARNGGNNYFWTWYDNVGGQNWVLMSNPDSAVADLNYDLAIGGTVRPLGSVGGAPGQVQPGQTLYAQYPLLRGGPVDVGTVEASGGLTSQRILWPSGGNSLEEVLGIEATKLSSHFYWTWYDQSTAGFINWVMISNPVNGTPVYYEIRVGGAIPAFAGGTGIIKPGLNATPFFPGLQGGPVEVYAWISETDPSGTVQLKTQPAPVMASQRVLSGGGPAFNEVPGIPASELSGDYLWTWYDNHSDGAGNWIMIANPGDTSTNPGLAPMYYEIWIGGAKVQDDTTGGGPIPAGGYIFPTFGPPDVAEADGPVRVKTFTDAGHTAAMLSIASQRVLWGPSFEEVPGQGFSTLASTWHWTWYDQSVSGVYNWVMVAKPDLLDPTPIYYKVLVAGVEQQPCTLIPPSGRDIPAFPGQIGGPVEVKGFSDNNCLATSASIMASQRVLWKGNFNETLGTVIP
ncbi:MAG: TolB family protein [Thermoleophilia bacterium]